MESIGHFLIALLLSCAPATVVLIVVSASSRQRERPGAWLVVLAILAVVIPLVVAGSILAFFGLSGIDALVILPVAVALLAPASVLVRAARRA